MLQYWLQMSLLQAESQQVVWLRMMKLVAGGPQARLEAERMISEKLAAAGSAAGSLMLGASPESVVRGYRRKVRSNRRRLSK
ncbi:hypothetical protein [Labrys monachus]|uniref:Uncharacterized protein n=1 Tax=Labrys monachus TaxID=217067 RepID=A0ABU0F9C3_9HYPH|nr:hypothetical protein [Labrys monachus]MDQ0390660.1 hypothetical protein [Labrys monachus]